jgi:hypothetical protein
LVTPVGWPAQLRRYLVLALRTTPVTRAPLEGVLHHEPGDDHDNVGPGRRPPARAGEDQEARRGQAEQEPHGLQLVSVEDPAVA